MHYDFLKHTLVMISRTLMFLQGEGRVTEGRLPRVLVCSTWEAGVGLRAEMFPREDPYGHISEHLRSLAAPAHLRLWPPLPVLQDTRAATSCLPFPGPQRLA